MQIQEAPEHGPSSFVVDQTNLEFCDYCRFLTAKAVRNYTRASGDGWAAVQNDKDQRRTTNDERRFYCLNPIHFSDTTMELPGFCGS